MNYMYMLCILDIVAVPVSPPNPYQSAYTSETLLRIIHDCGAAFVLTSRQFANDKSIIKLIQKSRPVPWHCEVATEIFTDQMDAGEGGSDSEILGAGEGGDSELFADQLGAGEGGSDSDIELDMAKPEHVPFLQYTSGSTGR
jgi:acyl-CoA synthetase (AMP-forming)/AMP-acid ligase II